MPTSDISPIPDTVTSIGDYAFYGNYAIQSVELPAGLTHLGEGAFYGCSGLRSIVIPDGKVSAVGTISYVDDDAVGYETTLSTAADASGNTHYEYIKAATPSA